jgi:hypothetical protein
MKLRIPKIELIGSAETFLRTAGYALIKDSHSGQVSYVRRLGDYFYPRLHMYFTEEADDFVFNLHLDQKQASYAGVHMHNAEHDGEVVEAEIKRLRNLIL